MPSSVTSNDDQSVINQWADLKGFSAGGKEDKLLVCLCVRCKVVKEDDQGALHLGGTAVQRVVFSSDAPDTRPPDFRAFEMKTKGHHGRPLVQGSAGPNSWKLHEEEEANESYWIAEQKFEIDNCPLENYEHSHS